MVVKPSASIAAMVSSEKRTSFSVFPYVPIIFGMEMPITRPAMSAAIRMPVPVADNQLNV